MTDILKDKSVRLYLLLGGFFIANALIAELMGVKIFSLEQTLGLPQAQMHLLGEQRFSFDMTAGVLLWPFVFIMTDIINEYYGVRGVRFLSFLGAGLIAYAFFMFRNAIALPPASWWGASQAARGVADMNQAFSGIFGQGLAIIVGSLSAFILSQLIDVFTFHRIKRLTGERYLWVRSTGSTLVSQLIDTFVVTFVAFYFFPKLFAGNGEPWAIHQLLSVCIGSYLYKFTVAILLTPVIYLVHGGIERYLGHEAATALKLRASGT